MLRKRCEHQSTLRHGSKHSLSLEWPCYTWMYRAANHFAQVGPLGPHLGAIAYRCEVTGEVNVDGAGRNGTADTPKFLPYCC
jgi:hypothetical protein